MDPTRMTLFATGAGALLAAMIVIPVAIVSVVNDPGSDDTPALQEGDISKPAAQEAFAQGLKAEDAAYMNDRMEMTMQITDQDELLLGEARVRLDPDKMDQEFYIMIDAATLEEAYGNGNSTPNPEEDPFVAEMGLDERFEMHFVRLGPQHALSLGEEIAYTWRDHAPPDPDEFRFFNEDEDEEETDPPSDEMPDVSQPLSLEELERFMETDDTIAVHEIEASERKGTPTWKVTTTLLEEGAEGEAVFHFRQEDMAPLVIDMTMQPIEGGFFSPFDDDSGIDVDTLDDFEMRMHLEFRYGDDFEIVFPEGHTRLAATVETEDETSDTSINRTVTEDQEKLVPLTDLELHVVVVHEAAMWENPFGGPIVTETLATMELAQALEGDVEGYHIVYEDLDGDGHVSSGDRFQVTTEDEDGIWSNETHRVDLLVYDTWADAYEGAPGPGVLWVLGMLGCIGLARLRLRRRRRS